MSERSGYIVSVGLLRSRLAQVRVKARRASCNRGGQTRDRQALAHVCGHLSSGLKVAAVIVRVRCERVS